MSFAFVVPQVAVPVIAREPLLFPIRRIYCIGRNFAAHAAESGSTTNRANPFFFMKPTDAAAVQTLAASKEMIEKVESHITLTYPPVTESYHHEIELVVAIGPNAEGLTQFHNVDAESASEFIYGYAIGLDMTRRDLQAVAKSSGQPWDMAKGADESAGLSNIVLASDLKAQHPQMFVDPISSERKDYVCNASMVLSVNGNLRQDGNVKDMVNSVPEVISHLSHFVSLRQGDLIFTGTPSGVGPVRRGDLVTSTIQGLGTLTAMIS